MKSILTYLFLLSFVWLSGCAVEEAPSLDHAIIQEKEDELVEYQLRWKVNGEEDEGFVADMLLYFSESEDMDDAVLSESLGKVTLSYQDFYGHQRIVPSYREDIFNAYRYYLGAAFHGMNNPDASVSFPLHIEYAIDIVNQKTGVIIKTIEGDFEVTESMKSKTTVHYTYTMDVVQESEHSLDHWEEGHPQIFSLRQLAEPITVSRESDVVRTNTFANDANLHVELLWKVNGQGHGFEEVDLDLFAHDTNNSNIFFPEDLDFHSRYAGVYEGFTVSPSATFLKLGVPEKVGFNFCGKELAGAATIDYMLNVYQIDGKIKRKTIFGSFTSPPAAADEMTFYFPASITRTTGSYTIQTITPTQVWKP